MIERWRPWPLWCVLSLVACGCARATEPGRLGPGLHTIHLAWGGEMRKYLLYVPRARASAQPVPVIVNFHGGRSQALDQVALSRMNPAADQAGFAVVYPEGVGWLRWHTFNAGACCGYARWHGSDDVGFAMAAVDDAARRVPLRASRIAATGMSNGAMMAYRLACERADRVAAIAPVAGVPVVGRCEPSRPVSILHFHGTADGFIPYDGLTRYGYPSVRNAISAWRTFDGCSDESTVTFRRAEVECVSSRRCAGGAEVTVCTLREMGHTWPGGRPFLRGGATSASIDATATMLRFFEQHLADDTPAKEGP